MKSIFSWFSDSSASCLVMLPKRIIGHKLGVSCDLSRHSGESREANQRRQSEMASTRRSGAGRERVIPNPKLKLLDQVREVMRLKHYSLRTERSYCDWIRRHVKFHGMRSRVPSQAGGAQVQEGVSVGERTVAAAVDTLLSV